MSVLKVKDRDTGEWVAAGTVHGGECEAAQQVSDKTGSEMTQLWAEFAGLRSTVKDWPVLAERSYWLRYGSTGMRLPLADVTEVHFVSDYEPTGQEDESWNADAGREGTIKGYRTGTVVTISAEGSEKIRMNSYATGMFANMEKLTTVTGWELLDGTNVETTHGAFARDYALTSVDLSGVQMPNWSGGNGMFNYCEALQTVKLPRYGIPKLTAVESMFDGCTNLKEADLGRGLTLVGKKMFYKCLNLQQIQGLETVSAIGDRAFVYTPALAAVDLRDRNVKTIGESACRMTGMEDSVALTSAPDVGQMATRSKRWDADARKAIRQREFPSVYIPVPNTENQDNYPDIQFGSYEGEPVSVAEGGCTALTLYHAWNAVHAGTDKEYDSFRAWWNATIGATDYAAGNVMDSNTVPKMLEILGWESDGNIPVEGAEQLDILLERLEQGLPTYASIQSANNVGGTHSVLIIGADAARKKLAVLDSHVVGTEGVVSWLSFEDIFTHEGESYDGIDPMDYGVG